MMVRAPSQMNALASGTSTSCVSPAIGPVKTVSVNVPGTALTNSLPSGPIVCELVRGIAGRPFADVEREGAVIHCAGAIGVKHHDAFDGIGEGRDRALWRCTWRATSRGIRPRSSLCCFRDHRAKAGRSHPYRKINGPFLSAAEGSPAEYAAGLKLAIERGWLWTHWSGTFVKLTDTGAALFA
jgi:hypothetical protein